MDFLQVKTQIPQPNMLKRFILSKMMITSFGLIFFCTVSYAQVKETSQKKDVQVNQIMLLYNQQKWEEGKRLADESLQKTPKDSDLRMMAGKYYLHKKQYDKARYELAKSLEYGSANTESKQMLIAVETESERYSSAICYINELLEVNPYGKELWRKKIDLYRISGNQVEADRLLKRISQIYPNDPEISKDLSYIIEQRTVEVSRSGKIDKTIELARQTVEDQPNQQELYFPVIDNYIKAGDFSNALAYTDRALNHFPKDEGFVKKKLAILEHEDRYSELLGFLNAEMKNDASGNLRNLYNYYLLEAARNAKESDPVTLYGKIFDASPGNTEAFNYVFSELFSQAQYEEAIHLLNRRRNSVGPSKELDLKELNMYKSMQNLPKVSSFTKELFKRYPDDADLRESYVTLTLKSAKNSMDEGKINTAIADWKEAIQYGDQEAINYARIGMYNAYQSSKQYPEAIAVLDEMLIDDPENLDLIMKKSDLYNKQGSYDYALTIYEQILEKTSGEERSRLQNGYSEIASPLVKNFREEYKLIEARKLCERWLVIDNHNQEALIAITNISYQLQDYDAMLAYSQTAVEFYTDDIPFKIKLAEAMSHKKERLGDSWELLHNQVIITPFHQPLLNTFNSTSEEYAEDLIKNKEHANALAVIDTALHYKENNKALKYLKGRAYEGLKVYDSAYYYQKFYEPAPLEFDEFKQHLDYLAQRSYQNTLGISHLNSRFGDNNMLITISSIEYSHKNSNGAMFTGRLNYAGREEGQGVQGLIEWTRPWTKGFSSRIDLAISNRYFMQYAANAALLYDWESSWQLETAVGFRKFFTDQNLTNFNLALAKTINDFKLSGKLSNFLLADQGNTTYLYNVGLKAQYFLSNPRNFVLAVANVGNSADIDLVDYQLFNSFEVTNAMVGAGIGRSITRNISANALGTWYNFQAQRIGDNNIYRNHYNLNLQINVSF